MKSTKITTLAIAAFAALALAAPASALGAPELELSESHVPPTAPVPQGTYAIYELSLSNVGDAATSGAIEIDFAAPAGFEILEVSDVRGELFGLPLWECSSDTSSVSCTGIEPNGFFGGPLPIGPGEEACVGPLFGNTCPIVITMRAEPDAPPATGTPTIEACGGGATPACDSPPGEALEIVPFGFDVASFDGEVLDALGDPATQAGARPHTASTEFHFTTAIGANGTEVPTEELKDATARLPAGFVGNPQAYPTCTRAQLGTGNQPVCPPDSQLGTATIYFNGFFGTPGTPGETKVAVYNMAVPFGLPALFGFNVSGNPVMVYAELRTGDDYGVDVTSKNAPQTLTIEGIGFDFWGVPADPSHDADRRGSGCPVGCSAEVAPSPFITLPTSCVGPVETFLDVTTWQDGSAGDSFLSHDNTEPIPNPIGATGCNSVLFDPEIEARPTTNAADAPSGLDVKLTVPQHEDCEPNPSPPPQVVCETASAHLKDTTVTLPEGLTVNPSGANGLKSCSESEIDLDGKGKDRCPDASRLADVTVRTPLLEAPMPGSVYLADPYDNPFDSLIALYLVVDDEKTGIVVKLAGEVDLDSDGQLSATFEENPQLPFEEFELEFFGGSAGALRTPAVCGDYTTESQMTPWTAPERKTEHPSDTWAIQGNCSDSEGSMPHAPAFNAGTVHPIAGAESPFVMHLRREDGSQNIKAVNVSPPPGLLAKLAGTQICPDAFLAAAEGKDGSDEEDSPSCPATSRLGRVVAGAGAGPAPYYAPGTAYLAGPYKGAPLSIAIITPAVAGPFDLGTIVVRIAAYVDRSTARITAVSDPLPESLENIPLDIKTVDVAFDKPGFTRNPTSCDPMAVDGLVTSTLGALAPVENRFQVGECGRLGFKPSVFLRLFGKRFTRGANPRLRAIVMPRAGDANIGRTAVTMPRSLFLDQSHIRTVCTRVQFAANACPPGSIYGSAIAFSPLVDYPVQGNVYLRSSNNKLPDLVADLKGPAHQPIRVEVVGRTDSVKGALRNTFDVVPDVPVTKFVLHLQAGKKSLLVASRNLCQGAQRANVNMSAQNGRQLTLAPKIRIPCAKQRKRGKKGKRRNRAAVSRATARP